MAISSKAALAAITTLATQTSHLPCSSQTYDPNKLAFANKVAAIVIHILSNEALCKDYMTQLNAAVLSEIKTIEPNFSTMIKPKEYQNVRNVRLPVPDDSIISNEILEKLLLALRKVLLKNQQEHRINVGLNENTTARLLGQIPNQPADEMILNRQIWTEVSIKPESIYHGAFSHAIQLYIILNALDNKKIDLSIFTQTEQDKLAQEQYFLHPYLVNAYTNFKFAVNVPTEKCFYRNSHWNIALDNDTANRHSMLPLFLNDKNKVSFNFCSPNYIQYFLLKEQSFSSYNALSSAIFFDYSKSIVECYASISPNILSSVNNIVKTMSYQNHSEITEALLKIISAAEANSSAGHRIYPQGPGIFYNYRQVTAAAEANHAQESPAADGMRINIK